MGIERNLKILIVDASFRDEMMKKAFLQDESNDELIKKIPDELNEIAKKIEEGYIGTSDSCRWNYYTENILVKKLCLSTF